MAVLSPQRSLSSSLFDTAEAIGIMVNSTTNLTSALSNSTGCNGGDIMVTCNCSSSETNSTSSRDAGGSLDALLYIVVVLLFYAFSIVVMMVKYIRRENKEAHLRQYFDEFVTREQFQSPQARNQECMKSLLESKGINLDVKRHGDHPQLDTLKEQEDVTPERLHDSEDRYLNKRGHCHVQRVERFRPKGQDVRIGKSLHNSHRNGNVQPACTGLLRFHGSYNGQVKNPNEQSQGHPSPYYHGMTVLEGPQLMYRRSSLESHSLVELEATAGELDDIIFRDEDDEEDDHSSHFVDSQKPYPSH